MKHFEILENKTSSSYLQFATLLIILRGILVVLLAFEIVRFFYTL